MKIQAVSLNEIRPIQRLNPFDARPVPQEEQNDFSVATREDSFAISPEALAKIRELQGSGKEDPENSSEKDLGANGKPLSDEEKDAIKKLKDRDNTVRTHEQAHIAAGGQHVRGGAKFSYQTGPDGSRYAVGGEVNIDTSPVSGDPEATIRKMEKIRAAAMAPADPSGQDQAVAASATAAMTQAQADKSEKPKETKGASSTNEKEPKVANSDLKDSKQSANTSASSRGNSLISAYTRSQNTAGMLFDRAG